MRNYLAGNEAFSPFPAIATNLVMRGTLFPETIVRKSAIIELEEGTHTIKVGLLAISDEGKKL